jgi:hypothetical protein
MAKDAIQWFLFLDYGKSCMTNFALRDSPLAFIGFLEKG